MRQFISTPSPDKLIILQVWDGARPEGEFQYEVSVYTIEAQALPGGSTMELSSSIRLGTLGALVTVLCNWGHQRTDPIIRYAAQAWRP